MFGGFSLSKRNVFKEKLRESVASVVPITLIVAVLCFFFVPIESGLMLSFLIGAFMVIVGMAMFTIGADVSMTQIGSHIGGALTRSRRLRLIVLLSFLLGMMITVSEPDLQILAKNVPSIDGTVLIVTVAAGVGIFLVISMLRIFFSISLKWLFIVFYAVLFVLAAFADRNFLSVAFDSGGVTTGPMTVPFIISLGVGIAATRSDKKAKDDSFGLVALCSIGPILAVLILGFIYRGEAADSSFTVNTYGNTVELGWKYLREVPTYMKEVAAALLPIVVFFLIFQVVSLRIKKRPFLGIMIGLLFTYSGLILFMTGVNVGFLPLGYALGSEIVNSGLKYLLIPLAVLMGWFIIRAEPAVHVLNKQVEELSAGAVSAKAMGLSLSIAVAAAMGLSMVRVLTGMSVMWFFDPGIFDRADPFIFCSSDIYGNRFRLGRCGIRTDDRDIYVPVCDGRLRRSRRECHNGCVRARRSCCDDASHNRSDHGRDLGCQKPQKQTRDIFSGRGRRGCYRTLGGCVIWNFTVLSA